MNRVEQIYQEEQGFNLMLMTVQRHLNYPRVLDRKGAFSSLTAIYGSDCDSEHPGSPVLFMRSHSKTHRSKKDGNQLTVRFQVFRAFNGLALEEQLLSLLPELFVVKWHPLMVQIAAYLIPRNPSLHHLTTDEILGEYLLFWLAEDIIKSCVVPEDFITDKTLENRFLIKDVRGPVWGDSNAFFTFNFTSEFFEVAGLKITVPFFAVE